ncbi:VOC family protein [Roseibacterium sp. SDUM158016]|uniref:VOC family protein n=1 Tax=Roseicyclus sediminis TaxID=2980997 RepID=UPI0021D0CE3B|nr:VOC family protein [Roseibacterium sp. SDUM158016]MCU4652155.1 VOC family protein [Roseibacterium sp. SDUM158016]
MTDRGFKVRGLGEVAIRCNDLAAMTAFYEDIIGLGRLPGNASDDIVFFRIAEGFGGHTAVLALFDRTLGTGPDAPTPETGARSSLHHIALSLPFAEQEAAMRWYEANGIPYRVEHFGWIGWRGVFTQDPEGNTVELVAHHPDLETP